MDNTKANIDGIPTVMVWNYLKVLSFLALPADISAFGWYVMPYIS